MLDTMTDTSTLVITSCPSCGIKFAMPESKYNACREDSKQSFYCPNGHCLSYFESRSTKLERELFREKASHDRSKAWGRDQSARADKVTRKLTATKGVVTRIKNRVGNGVCPCCNRTFKQLARHMKKQHPQYAKESA